MRSSLIGQMKFNEGCRSALRGILRSSPISSLDVCQSRCEEEERRGEKKKKKKKKKKKTSYFLFFSKHSSIDAWTSSIVFPSFSSFSVTCFHVMYSSV
jgi:hypothetical protein